MAVRKRFGQLILYYMKNTFLDVSYTKFGAKASPRIFSKKITIVLVYRSTV